MILIGSRTLILPQYFDIIILIPNVLYSFFKCFKWSFVTNCNNHCGLVPSVAVNSWKVWIMFIQVFFFGNSSWDRRWLMIYYSLENMQHESIIRRISIMPIGRYYPVGTHFFCIGIGVCCLLPAGTPPVPHFMYKYPFIDG